MKRHIRIALCMLGGAGLFTLLVTSLSLAQSDTTPPHVISFEFAPSEVDTSLANREITFTLHLTDDISGIMGKAGTTPSQAEFTSPSGQQIAYVTFIDPEDLISGNKLDGVYRSTLHLPQYSETGTWHLQRLLLVDAVANRRLLNHDDMQGLGFPTTFQINAAVSDTDPPHVVSFDFTPKVVAVESSNALITVTMHLTDTLSGVTDGIIGGIGRMPTRMRFTSPSGQQIADLPISPKNLVSGDPLDGIYQNNLTLSTGSETGIWQLQYLLLVDDVGNQRWLDRSAMESRGFPTQFEVQSKALQAYPSSATE